MIVLGRKSQEGQQYKGFNQIPFETEMSQDAHLEDKQFSPWVRKKTKKVQDIESNQIQYHNFLANINLKHKKVENSENPQKEQISTLRKNLQNKLKAERIHNEDYIELIKSNRKSIEQKSYFQKRTTFRSFQKKPKCLELSIEWDQKKGVKASHLHSPSAFSSSQGNKKKQNTIVIRRAKKSKKNLRDQRQFAETMKDFHKNIDVTSKFYKTLQLNVYPMTQRKFSPKDLKQKQQRVRFSSLNNRAKYNSMKLQKQKDYDSNYTITCEGKNLLSTSYGKTRREKLRKQLQQRQMKEVIFLK